MARDTGSAARQAGAEVFTRRSSGLIKSAGTYDVFIFNLGLISVGIAVALDQYLRPGVLSGSQRRPVVAYRCSGC
jgi:hypothetical protein